MNRLKYSACAFAVLLSTMPAHAVVTYKWVIYNNFYLYGNNIQQLEPSTCTDMDCPSIAPTSVPYHAYTYATAKVTGLKPSGEVYVGFLWGDGVSKNECGFALSGGTVNTDGSATKPKAVSYLTKYTTNGSTVYPGCPQPTQDVQQTDCDSAGNNCTFTGYFQINQTQ